MQNEYVGLGQYYFMSHRTHNFLKMGIAKKNCLRTSFSIYYFFIIKSKLENKSNFDYHFLCFIYFR